MSTKHTAASNAAEIEELRKKLDSATKLFGENAPMVKRLRDQLAETMILVHKASGKADKALKLADKALKLTDLLDQRMIEDHDYIVSLLIRVNQLEKSGGSPSNLSSLIASGFTPEERQAIMELSAKTEMSDDELVAYIFAELRAQLRQLTDIMASHSVRHDGHDDKLSALDGRVSKLERASGGGFRYSKLYVFIGALVAAAATIKGFDAYTDATYGQLWLVGIIAGVAGACIGALPTPPLKADSPELEPKEASALPATEPVEVKVVQQTPYPDTVRN